MLLQKEIQNAFNYQEYQNVQFENIFLIVYQFPILVQKINEEEKEKIILRKSENKLISFFSIFNRFN